MSYALLGLIGRNLSEVHRAIPGSHLIELPQGIWLLPMTESLLDSIDGLPDAEHMPDTFSAFMAENLATALFQLTKQTFAYLEIDCEGGTCQRTASLFVDGWPVWSTSEDGRAESVFREAGMPDSYVICTNLALRLLGVKAEPPNDELATLGLTESPFRRAWWNFETFDLNR